MSSIDKSYFKESDKKDKSWMGDITFYNIVVKNKTAKNAAWCYKTPDSTAIKIKNHITFATSIKVEKA